MKKINFVPPNLNANRKLRVKHLPLQKRGFFSLIIQIQPFFLVFVVLSSSVDSVGVCVHTSVVWPVRLFSHFPTVMCLFRSIGYLYAIPTAMLTFILIALPVF